MILDYINNIIQYGINKKLISEYDINYVFNQFLDLFKIENISEFSLDNSNSSISLNEILEFMIKYALENSLISDDTITNRDLFDTKIMSILTPYPHEVINTFKTLYAISPKQATDYFYTMCQDCNYIRSDRIAKDLKWKTTTKYGEIDITINLSKPEKDPRDIIAQKNAVSSNYPKCLLCVENEGYSGRINHPARQNLRLIPLNLNNEAWSFQYSPYVYYNEHCIILNNNHVPMKINSDTFKKLLEFVAMFPHYFVGSNADLPIVGGSILSHDHFQGGNYEFAMAKAPTYYSFKITDFEEVNASIVKWPMSVIRIRHRDISTLSDCATLILNKWKAYCDESVSIYAYTNDTPHNTITPIARKKGDYFELDLVLRNNLTTKEHPLGLFHPHSEYHHIKKENIGLIEVMGLAVLPARLKEELSIIENILLSSKDISSDFNIDSHKPWIENIRLKYAEINKENVRCILEEEIGNIFVQILENAGVFKTDSIGISAFKKFTDHLSEIKKEH